MKEDIQIASEHMKRYSVISEMQIKTAVKYYSEPTRITSNKKKNNTT